MFIVTDHSESEDDQTQEKHLSMKRKFAEQQCDQQKTKKH